MSTLGLVRVPVPGLALSCYQHYQHAPFYSSSVKVQVGNSNTWLTRAKAIGDDMLLSLHQGVLDLDYSGDRSEAETLEEL